MTVGLALLAGLLSSGAAFGHDFWLEPSSFTPLPGSDVTIRLRVGEHFKGEAVPRNARRIERFFAAGPGGELPVQGEHGADPAGRVDAVPAGLMLVGYRNRPAYIELEAGKFERYLAEEGLDQVIETRRQRQEQGEPSREIYSRCAKALLAVGPAAQAAAGFDRRLGFTLELVPEANPYAMPGGGLLPVRLFYRDQPLQGALVVALHQDDPAHPISARTDAGGLVALACSRPGTWLVKAVHMVEAGTSAADWESLWASLTFRVPERVPEP